MIELNKVMLVGRLTRDPETRYTSTGKAVANFSIAVNRRTRGEREDETAFVDCEAWDRQAEFLQQWFHKGKPIFVEGRLRQDNWEDRNTGQRRSKLIVTAERLSFVGGKDEGDGGGSGGGGRDSDDYDRATSGQGGGGGGSAAPRQQSRQAPAAAGASGGDDSYDRDYSEGDENVDDDLPF